MVDKIRAEIWRAAGCVVVLLFVVAFFVVGCESLNRDCQKAADEVVKADQWFREKFW